MLAVVFPGQGAQKPQMGQDLYRSDPLAKSVFDRVSQSTGVDVAKLCFESDEATLRETQNAQLALYTCGLSAYAALRAAVPGLRPVAFAGHSVGEYTALAAAGVLTLEEGARLVRRRGELMAGAGHDRPGTMAAVIGLDAAELEAAIGQPTEGVCVVANDNCPGQLVMSGDWDAVQSASARAGERGAKRVVPLQVSGAFHSPLMEGASKSLGDALSKTTFERGEANVYSNVTARPEDDWPALLQRQLKSRVRWTETVQNMRADGITTFVECGSGEVLTGLLKRIDRAAQGLYVVDQATLDETARVLREAA